LEHGFPLIRSLRASAQRSTSVLFSFVLSLLILAGSFAILQSKTTLVASIAGIATQRFDAFTGDYRNHENCGY
jgi:hypothetical protein